MPTNPEIRPLSALRGLAAVWVLLHHLTGMAPPVLAPSLVAKAWTGVDIFFVLSGFLLTAVYGSDARLNLARFYTKRLCRLFPLHVTIMVGLAVMVLAAPYIGLRLTSDRFHAWSNFPVVLLLMQPYWPGQGLWWNAPSWSASVELICYTGFPFFVPALRGLAGTGRVALMAVAILLEVALQYGSTEGVYTGLGGVARGASSFVLGVLLHGLVVHWRPRRIQASVFEAAGFGGIIVCCAADVPYLVQACGAVLIAALSRQTGILAYMLSAAPFVWLGRISFSIYLLHEPLIALLLKLLPPGGAAEMALTPSLHRLLLVALVVACASVSYKFIEVPGQRLPSLLATVRH